MLSVGAVADETPLATDTDFVFGMNTLGSPYLVSSLASAQQLVYKSGETVTVTAPSGAATTPVSSAATDGSYAWTPNAPGTWSLSNNKEGEATFKVWYSLFPSQAGAGTLSDPVAVVDGGDLAVMASGGTISSGGYFRPSDSATIADVSQPSGYSFKEIGDGVFQINASVDGLLYDGLTEQFAFDSRLPGPGRRVRHDESCQISYSGNGWKEGDTLSSSLEITAPDGTTATSPLVGTGTVEFPGRMLGVWHLALTANGETLESDINVTGGTIMIVW